MQVIRIVSLVTTLLLSLTACGGNAAPVSSTDSSAAVYKIGITQLVEHESLDAAYRGFVDGLRERGYEDGKNIALDYQNAQGTQANCQTIAQQFIADQKDLILAISTPSAQAVANLTQEIPILCTAVTNPENSKLVAANTAPGGNLSGTSDLAPIAQQIALIREFLPTAKTVGLLYSSSEDNSLYQIGIAKAECEKLGLQTVEATVTGINDIGQVVQSLVTKVDAIYSPTDNVIASAMPNVLQIANEAKVPTFTGWAAEGDQAGMAAVAVDYYALGKLTAGQAVEILQNSADTATMPIAYLESCKVYVNADNAAALGIPVPEAYHK